MANSTLVVCGCCSRHIRPSEPNCPFCGLTETDAANGISAPSPWYAIAAVSASIVLSGCPAMMTRYGAPPQPTTQAVAPARETMEIYGAPPPMASHDAAAAMPMERIDPAPGVNPAQPIPPTPPTPMSADAGVVAEQEPNRPQSTIYGAPPPRHRK